ncbi:dehydrogenase [Herbaspirillum frisingense GSF30]|uniref:Dehydrogenase n=1 Tax=Herbaspirillum frisingense GSF30 TaxID=864073 RepID=A0AAI9IG79_9BURK|nr:dehydrogenase [Herbaspirillum frisingense GSF30]
MRPALEAVDHIGQAAGAFGQVGCVDLGDVTQADDLGARTRTRDQRLHLFGREVLRFIDDQELVHERTAAHEVQRLDLDTRADQVLGRCPAPFAGVAVGLVEHFEVVVEGAHPGAHLFFLGPWQETDVFADRHRHTGDDDFVVELGFKHLRQARGECQQGLAGTGLAQQGDEVALRVHQQVQREVLLAVAGGDAPDAVLGVAEVAQGLQYRRLAVDLGHLAIEGRFAVLGLDEDELVDQQRRHVGTGDAVVGIAAAVAALLPRLHALAVLVPEVVRQLLDARVQQVGIFQHVVVEVVFGGQANGTRLQAHVDVLGHQHHRTLRILLVQRPDHAQDLVVGLALGQTFRQGGILQLGLEVQAALGILVAQLGERNAQVDGILGDVGHQRIQRTRDLARIAGDFGHALLVVVQLLQRHHGQVDVVFLEAEQRGRIVHQHVGIQHEQLGLAQLVSHAAGGRLGTDFGALGRGFRFFGDSSGLAGDARTGCCDLGIGDRRSGYGDFLRCDSGSGRFNESDVRFDRLVAIGLGIVLGRQHRSWFARHFGQGHQDLGSG